MSSTAFDLARAIGATIRKTRRESRWSQTELARRLGSSQAAISRLEAGRTRDIDGRLASGALNLLGIRVSLDGGTIGLAGRREQRDLVHAVCAGYVARRLVRSGWQVRLEVEVGGGRIRGWIDVLAFREVDRSLIVGEIKTRIVDVGAIQRTISWYEREAWSAAHRLAWRPRTTTTALLLLASAENDLNAQLNRAALKRTFPSGGTELGRWVAEPTGQPLGGAIATVDPRLRATDWLRPTRSDGRRRSAPYLDYADAARQLTGRPPSELRISSARR